AQGRHPAEVMDTSSGKHCKRMAHVGYSELAGDTDDPAAAWRARLARDGKLRPGGSLRDLVFGSDDGTNTQEQRHHHSPDSTDSCRQGACMDYPRTVGELTAALRQCGYLADRGLSTALLVGMSLHRPVLLEGEVGVGKTEAAKAIATTYGKQLIRLQCYEGIDTNQALY